MLDKFIRLTLERGFGEKFQTINFNLEVQI